MPAGAGLAAGAGLGAGAGLVDGIGAVEGLQRRALAALKRLLGGNIQ